MVLKNKSPSNAFLKKGIASKQTLQSEDKDFTGAYNIQNPKFEIIQKNTDPANDAAIMDTPNLGFRTLPKNITPAKPIQVNIMVSCNPNTKSDKNNAANGKR